MPCPLGSETVSGSRGGWYKIRDLIAKRENARAMHMRSSAVGKNPGVAISIIVFYLVLATFTSTMLIGALQAVGAIFVAGLDDAAPYFCILPALLVASQGIYVVYSNREMQASIDQIEFCTVRMRDETERVRMAALAGPEEAARVTRQMLACSNPAIGVADHQKVKKRYLCAFERAVCAIQRNKVLRFAYRVMRVIAVVGGVFQFLSWLL